jgi:biopolymer transport protein ExbB
MIEFLKAGGPFMWLLLATSVIGVGFILERVWVLRRNSVIPPEVGAAIERAESAEQLVDLQSALNAKPSPISRLIAVAIDHLEYGREEAVDAVETRARQEVLKLERGLVVLEVVVGVAPLLGLVGTLHGLTTLFGGLSGPNADNAVLSKGIAIALNTTLMGLLVAIPSLVAWSYFTKKVETFAVEMETLCDEFLRKHQRLTRVR